MTKLKKPLMKDYCTPFIFDPGNKDIVSFDSRGYSKAAAKYIEQLETEKTELVEALKGMLTVDDHTIDHSIKMIDTAQKAIRNNCPVS